ncbi:MAG TPA: transglycosylase SLT domain-containing protein [Ferrovibrio sp.]|uniref:transglycosylase SLT domain-containing protein n=1 Tax=Ferrovibrio sp. TaxID=1917215 RepID=UPI002ED2C3CC
MAPISAPSAALRPDTYRIGGHQVSYELLSTLRQASHRTGVDFAYLVAQAGQESGFQPNAQARTSSARGLFQFVESTWLELVRDHGSKYGLAAQAQQISTGSDGRPRVGDAEARREILALRDDPRIASVMAAEYARSNEQALSRELGVDLNSVDLYLGHFLGAAGAGKFLAARLDDPSQSAAALLPEAAAANRSVFYTADGQPRSVGDIYADFQRKLANNIQGLDLPPTTGRPRISAVANHLAEQRRITDQAVKIMAFEALRDMMLRDRKKPGSDIDSSW